MQLALFKKNVMKYSLIISGFLILVLSCKKKETLTEEAAAPSPTPSSAYTVKDYLPLKYGNYWVYQFTITDSNNVVNLSMLDSVYVFDSVVVHGKWFYRIMATVSPIQGEYTDSANCLIRSNGQRALSLINNDTILKLFWNQSGSWYNNYDIMKTTATAFNYNSVTYPNCISRYTYFYSNMNSSCPNRIIYDTYSPGVGLVYSKWGFVNDCRDWEIKILRYKLN